jgi:SAM-dependent methyltransferase
VSAAVFGAEYATAYDWLYEDKDYVAECDLVEQVFSQYASGPVRRILDLGCGTGQHAARLAERGYTVVGVDRSPHMLEQARARSGAAEFVLGDIRALDLGQRFDAVLMMFAVLGYHTANADVLAALRAARGHLAAGGLFFCDLWYGPAVLHQGPSERVKVIERPGGQLIRVASGELDVRQQLCTVRYHLWHLEARRLVAETREQHVMRYFFPLELEQLLADAEFELVRLGAFPSLDVDPTPATWNAAIVARAR